MLLSREALKRNLFGMDFWTIEVLDGSSSADLWKDAYGDSLVEAANTHGVSDWAWSHHRWGVVLEVQFTDEADWLRFRALPTVRAALDAVPDPAGLIIYNGKGGGAGVRVPRCPPRHPAAGAIAAALPEETPATYAGSCLEPVAYAVPA